MKSNQNFMSNFSDQNMTDSVKLAEYPGSSFHQDNTRKQFLKYAAGGRDQYEPSDERDKAQPRFELPPDIKPIKTEQSQVSMDVYVRRNKSNEVEILKELRNEFEMIRNMPSHENKHDDKVSDSSEHPRSRRNRVEDESSSSLPSSKLKQKEVPNNREERLWLVERKQYEFMLTNCQHKIEELLHAEMEYKKIIHELRASTVMAKAPLPNKFEAEVKELQKQLKEEKQKNITLTTEVDRLKSQCKQQGEKIAKFQSEYSVRSKDESKLNDERRKLEEYLRLEKDKYMNCQIEKRKFQMENELLLKEREQEASRFQRQLEHQNVVNQLQIKNIIKKFEDEIEVKDRRYMLLLSEFEKIKRENAGKKEDRSSNNQMIDLFHKILEDKRSSHNEEFNVLIKSVMHKLENRDREDESEIMPYDQTERLLAEIKNLKAEIESLRNRGSEGVDIEPIKKIYEAEISALKDTIAILERKIKNNGSPQKPGPFPFNQIEVAELQRRIAELEEVNARLSGSTKSDQLLANQRKKIAQLDEELRAERKRRFDVEFEVTKLLKELELKTSILNNEKESLLRIKAIQLDKANQNINHWRQQFENMKRFYQAKLAEKNILLERSMNSVEITTIKKNYEESLIIAQSAYEKQIAQLTERLSKINSGTLQYDSLFKKYSALENAYTQLQQSVMRARQTNQGIDHLWYIKEAEYNNICEIFAQLNGRHDYQLRAYPSQASSRIDCSASRFDPTKTQIRGEPPSMSGFNRPSSPVYGELGRQPSLNLNNPFNDEPRSSGSLSNPWGQPLPEMIVYR